MVSAGGAGTAALVRGDSPGLAVGGALGIGMLIYVAACFGASLSCVPLITRFAQRANGRPLMPAEQQYTRALTEVWMGVLAALALANGILLIMPPQSLAGVSRWLLDTVPLLLFVGEHFYRRWRFAAVWPTPGLWVVVMAVMAERYPWIGKHRRR